MSKTRGPSFVQTDEINDFSAPNDPVLRARVQGDSFERIRIEADGSILTGDGTAAPATAGSTSATAVQIPTAVATLEYFVSKATSASDANNGLSWGSAFATIAGALTAIGGTTNNTNPAHLNIGAGTWGTSGSPLPTHTIKGVEGFRISGQGMHLTQLWGPDAASVFQFINCERAQVEDLQYMGSASATGWFVENLTNYSSGYVGGFTSTEFNAHRCMIGRTSTVAVAAYGIRWMLNGDDWHHDRTNDSAMIEDCVFSRITQPLSMEHSNSLCHIISDCTFINCYGCLTLHGGSASLINAVFLTASSAVTGWIIDIQDPLGSKSLSSLQQAVYFHPTSIVNLQAEANGTGWVRSTPNSGIAGSWPLSVTFTGCDMNAGPYAGTVGGQVVDWEAGNTNVFRYSQLKFIGCRLIPRLGQPVFYSPDAKSRMSFVNCEIYTDLTTFNWGGILTFIGCTAIENVATFTPIAGAVYSTSRCDGAIAPDTVPANFGKVITATDAAWAIPSGATVLEITAVGGGGQGGGGGSAAAAQLNAGGAGGAAGTACTRVVSVGANTTLNITVGAGGNNSGAGGAAAGNAGSSGQSGSNSTVVATGINVVGAGGRNGVASGASSTTAAGAGIYGFNGTSSGNPGAGGGGPSAVGGGQPGAFFGGGGAGGSAATATVGGAGGGAGSTTAGGATAAAAGSGAAGGNGVDAAANSGGGGGGGGGGAAGTGAGGNGGVGGSGYVIIRVIG